MKKTSATALVLVCGVLVGYILPSLLVAPNPAGAFSNSNCHEGLCRVTTTDPSVMVSVDPDYKSNCRLTAQYLNGYTVEICLRPR